jgi:hypothetical protein
LFSRPPLRWPLPWRKPPLQKLSAAVISLFRKYERRSRQQQQFVPIALKEEALVRYIDRNQEDAGSNMYKIERK